MKKYLLITLIIQLAATLNASQTKNFPWQDLTPEIQCHVLRWADDQCLVRMLTTCKTLHNLVKSESARQQLQIPPIKQWSFFCNKKNLNKLHNKKNHSVAISSDNRFIVTLKVGREFGKSTINIYDASTTKCITTIFEYTDWATRIAISKDNKRLITYGGKGIKTWHLENGICLSEVVNNAMMYHDRAMILSKDEDYLVTGNTQTGEVVKWDIKTGNPLKSLKTDHKPTVAFEGSNDFRGNLISCAQLSPQNDFVVTGGFDGAIKFWDLDKKICLHTIAAAPAKFFYNNMITRIRISSDSNKIVAATGKYIKIWNRADYSLIKTFENQEDITVAMTFNFDDSLLITGSGKIVKIWCVDTGTCIQTIHPDVGEITSVAISNDDSLIAITGKSGFAIQKFDLENIDLFDLDVDSATPLYKKAACTVS